MLYANHQYEISRGRTSAFTLSCMGMTNDDDDEEKYDCGVGLKMAISR